MSNEQKNAKKNNKLHAVFYDEKARVNFARNSSIGEFRTSKNEALFKHDEKHYDILNSVVASKLNSNVDLSAFKKITAATNNKKNKKNSVLLMDTPTTSTTATNVVENTNENNNNNNDNKNKKTLLTTIKNKNSDAASSMSEDLDASNHTKKILLNTPALKSRILTCDML